MDTPSVPIRRPQSSSKSRLDRLGQDLCAPVDIASLVYFRIAFGLIMLWEVWRYFDHGWIGRYWIDPVMNFTYYGFDWVRPWPGIGMYLHFVGLGALAIGIILGCGYRFCTTLFFLGFTYIFLLEKARYLNHFYLICLLSFLLIFIPAHRAFSIDAGWRPKLRSQTAPTWALRMLQLQLAIPYFYGGVAKLNGDWLQGEPMRMWMGDRADFPLMGQFFTQEWMIYGLSYGGLLLDLLVVPLLIWRRTRVFAFGAALIFHLMNAQLFKIGIFPWFMIAATMMFFRPDWPRLVMGWKRPLAGDNHPLSQTSPSSSLSRQQTLTLGFLGLYFVLQLLLPFRHYLYPGNVSWTEEGHRFAWHMKLRSKSADAMFVVFDEADNIVHIVEPEEFLPRWQARKMATRPDMILQFSHFLAKEFGEGESDRVEVRAEVFASLNGRGYQRLVDPTVNLAQASPTLKPMAWILPLQVPLSSS